MAFVESAVAQAREGQSVPDAEYELVIFQVDRQQNEETGRHSTRCIIRVENPPDGIDADPIYHYLVDVLDTDEKSTVTTINRMNRRFLTAFSVPFTDDGYDTDDLTGARGTIAVHSEEYEGRASNKLTLPKFE